VAEAASLNIEVLGPIRAFGADGADVTPEGVLQRRLLAFLVLRRGHVVSADAAVDVLWPARPPRDPTAALHNHLFRLRRSLPDGVIESVGQGYRLEPARVDLDADRLAHALSVGTVNGATPDRELLNELDSVLGRWHGPAYPELNDVDDGRAEAARLSELRIRAQEMRAELRLAADDTDGLVAELAALAESEPLRERPRALLMTALAASGRHVEALRVYDDFRRLLGDELGIEPSPSLAAQHAALLGGAIPPAARPTTENRLPIAVTPLVGRGALVDELTALVTAQRLVTLVGPGGVGKTRLLVELGHRIRGLGRPVVMCELATAVAGDAIDVVASALAIDARSGVPLPVRLAEVLAGEEVVILLDNCEHVLDPIAELTERLIGSCPNVTVVATSRERLRLAGEHVCTIPPLTTMADDSPAVELFVERARAADPSFTPGPEDLACVVEIVRRLDGLPLAIELAAARLHTHQLAEVAAGLDHRFDLLSAGYRTSPRHASLGAAVSWSYGLLDERLQRTFADLAVFSGPFTLTDAAAICDLDRPTMTSALAQLTERSLVMRAPGQRFVLLETLRAFGAEQLAVDARLDEVAERHARYAVEWTEAADRKLLEPGYPAIAEIDATLPELRSALGWLLAHGRVDLAGRLVAALLNYGFTRLRPDVLAWAERVVDADPTDASPIAPYVWAVAAFAAWMAGDVTEAGARAERARRLAEERIGHVPAEVATSVGSFHLFEGRLTEAATWYHHAANDRQGNPGVREMAAAAELLSWAYRGDPSAERMAADLLAEIGGSETPFAAYTWYCAGEVDLQTNPQRARTRFARAVELAERTKASFVLGLAGSSKASIDARLGDPAVAAADYRRLIDHWRRAGMWSTQWTMLRSIAGLLSRLGRHREAAVLEGAVQATAAGHRIFGADKEALERLGAQLRQTLGDAEYEQARREGALLDGDAAVELALHAL
jgi:predicted ATPase/DNA-binding SARP family transcriptional activator